MNTRGLQTVWPMKKHAANLQRFSEDVDKKTIAYTNQYFCHFAGQQPQTIFVWK